MTYLAFLTNLGLGNFATSSNLSGPQVNDIAFNIFFTQLIIILTANKRSQLVLIKVILRVLFWPHMSILLPVVCCQACQLFLAILMRRTIRLISESPSPNLLTRAHLVMQTGAVSMILMVSICSSKGRLDTN